MPDDQAIFELGRDAFARGVELFARFPHDRAWLEPKFERAEGRFFVDDLDQPRVAYYDSAFTHVGIGFIAGEADAPSATSFLQALAARKSDSFLFENISVPDDDWSRKLLSVYEPYAKALERTDYIFDPHGASKLDEEIAKGVAGYELRKVDVALADEIKKDYRDLGHVWPRSEDFVRDSLGYCAMQDDYPVAFCYSSFQLTRKILVAILTRPEHQRKGLASWAAARLVRDLAAAGMECHWTTFATNMGSRGVARRLGFQNETRHWWVQYKR